MSPPPVYWKLGHSNLDLHRFLAPAEALFTTNSKGKHWPRKQNTWKNANLYVQGLLAPGTSKSMQRIAHAVNTDQDRIERFVRESPWDHQRVQRWLVETLPSDLASPDASLNVDDTALIKKGQHSVGVYHQYAGCTGKNDNCQVAVNLTYAVPGQQRNADQVSWPLGLRLFLPEPWVNDAAYATLREETHLPEDVTYQPKWRIALDLLQQARSVPHKVIVADAGYGDNADFRETLRAWKEPYILGISPSRVLLVPEDAKVESSLRERLRYAKGTRCETPRQMAGRVKAWTKVTWAEGTKGPLSGLFWRTRVRVTYGGKKLRHVTDEVAWLVLEKRPNELKAYLCWGLDEASLEDLVACAHLRWTIEQFHKEGKQVLGLDAFEGRTWRGWHHHVTLVLLAYAFLALRRLSHGRGPRPTVPQVARALALEKATQDLVRERKMPRKEAQAAAEVVLRGVLTW
jgi:SRSO17 transposase